MVTCRATVGIDHLFAPGSILYQAYRYRNSTYLVQICTRLKKSWDIELFTIQLLQK
jgi:hypothetical protein